MPSKGFNSKQTLAWCLPWAGAKYSGVATPPLARHPHTSIFRRSPHYTTTTSTFSHPLRPSQSPKPASTTKQNIEEALPQRLLHDKSSTASITSRKRSAYEDNGVRHGLHQERQHPAVISQGKPDLKRRRIESDFESHPPRRTPALDMPADGKFSLTLTPQEAMLVTCVQFERLMRNEYRPDKDGKIRICDGYERMTLFSITAENIPFFNALCAELDSPVDASD
ncbi:hypothetical protein IWX90DRAFT_415365 [Phyllosticta citrichinensis]|uniref:Uncharacterized protein n=1 Tax=Phyllosticta citrichinensis TaxID=1130410 RepID=A0ABR1XV21_9PEZI